MILDSPRRFPSSLFIFAVLFYLLFMQGKTTGINVEKESHAINPMLHREATALILLDEDVKKINSEEEKKIIAFLIILLRQYKQLIRVDDIEAAAIMLFRISDEIIHRITINKEDIEEKRMLKELEDVICRYLFIPFGDKNP